MTKKLNIDKDLIVYCGIFENDHIENIVSFKGSKKEVIEFINKNYQRNEVICFFQNKTRFCFNHNINDINNWKSIDQLLKEDIIELKEVKKKCS